MYNRLPGTWQDLSQHLVKYKFYLSFENAFHCRDYLTEKIWSNALRAGVVPVIWGPRKEDIEAVLPKNSFIFAEDFNTVDELFQYLNKLDQNDEQYQRYFQWRRYNWLKTDYFPDKVNPHRTDLHPYGFCQLCKLLHEDDQKEKDFGVRPSHKVKSIFNWWYLNDTDECLQPHSSFEYFADAFYYRLLVNEVRYKAATLKKTYITFYIIIWIVLFFRRLQKMRFSWFPLIINLFTNVHLNFLKLLVYLHKR